MAEDFHLDGAQKQGGVINTCLTVRNLNYGACDSMEVGRLKKKNFARKTTDVVVVTTVLAPRKLSVVKTFPC